MLELENFLNAIERAPKAALYELLSAAESEAILISMFVRACRVFPQDAAMLSPFLQQNQSAVRLPSSLITQLPGCIYAGIAGYLPVAVVRSMGTTCRAMRAAILTAPEVARELQFLKELAPTVVSHSRSKSEREIYREDVVRADRLRCCGSANMKFTTAKNRLAATPEFSVEMCTALRKLQLKLHLNAFLPALQQHLSVAAATLEELSINSPYPRPLARNPAGYDVRAANFPSLTDITVQGDTDCLVLVHAPILQTLAVRCSGQADPAEFIERHAATLVALDLERVSRNPGRTVRIIPLPKLERLSVRGHTTTIVPKDCRPSRLVYDETSVVDEFKDFIMRVAPTVVDAHIHFVQASPTQEAEFRALETLQFKWLGNENRFLLTFPNIRHIFGSFIHCQPAWICAEQGRSAGRNVCLACGMGKVFNSDDVRRLMGSTAASFYRDIRINDEQDPIPRCRSEDGARSPERETQFAHCHCREGQAACRAAVAANLRGRSQSLQYGRRSFVWSNVVQQTRHIHMTSLDLRGQRYAQADVRGLFSISCTWINADAQDFRLMLQWFYKLALFYCPPVAALAEMEAILVSEGFERDESRDTPARAAWVRRPCLDADSAAAEMATFTQEVMVGLKHTTCTRMTVTMQHPRATAREPSKVEVPRLEGWWSCLQWPAAKDEEPSFFLLASVCPCTRALLGRQRRP